MKGFFKKIVLPIRLRYQGKGRMRLSPNRDAIYLVNELNLQGLRIHKNSFRVAVGFYGLIRYGYPDRGTAGTSYGNYLIGIFFYFHHTGNKAPPAIFITSEQKCPEVQAPLMKNKFYRFA